MLFGATETDNNLLSSSTVNISNISTHCRAMCMQLSSGWDSARLLIMKLKITKSNDSTISSQKILCPELPSPRLYFSFSLLQPSFPSPSLASYISLSLSPCSPPLLALQQTEWHHQPRLRCSKTQCARVCMCARGGMPEINIPTTKVLRYGLLHLKDQHFNKRSIVCVCVWDDS